MQPLLHNYQSKGLPTLKELRNLPRLGERFVAISSASVTFLYDNFLDRSTPEELTRAVLRFYRSCCELPLHEERVKNRIGIIRHALAHLARCPDPITEKLQRCLQSDGPYFVPGLGPMFWTSMIQGLAHEQHAAWTPAVIDGLQRVDLSTNDYSQICQSFREIRRLLSGMTALHVEHFLSLIAQMQGRNLQTNQLTAHPATLRLKETIHDCRAEVSLRQRLKDQGETYARAQEQFEQGLSQCDGRLLKLALSQLEPEGLMISHFDWEEHGDLLTLWFGRLWESDEPYSLLNRYLAEEPLPCSGLALPTSVLHLRDPQQYLPWLRTIREGYIQLDDSLSLVDDVEQYRLANEASTYLRARFTLHPFELPELFHRLGSKHSRDDEYSPRFRGFCADTFQFLDELSQHNSRSWMEQHRSRYQFVLRSPLTELCNLLTERYVKPVLCDEYGWQLDTQARNGRALTSICKNDFGQSDPYCTEQWIVFSRRNSEGRAKRQGPQFFVKLDTQGVQFGLRLGLRSRQARREFQAKVEQQGQSLFRALQERGALEHCQLYDNDSWKQWDNIEELVNWCGQSQAMIGRCIPFDSTLLFDDELVGEIILTFDRVLPLFAALNASSRSLHSQNRGLFSVEDFRSVTFQSADWLEHACDLLELKRQLILQGVPGTGKTHTARALARYLTGDNDDTVRVVQLHPSYSYEELVEGIKVRTQESNGRQEVIYPVEEGLLCSFAAEAEKRPSQPYVLILDEINRGNLPRIFGELLFLLEYRDQSVTLPYSRRLFRLPRNLYLIGTMNGSDRSIAPIDQALRRRFSFLEMAPDSRVLQEWFRVNPPEEGAKFAQRVIKLFRKVNQRLASELDQECQIGHSYFMIPQLNQSRMFDIWHHQIAPMIREQAMLFSRKAVGESIVNMLTITEEVAS